MKEYRGWFWRFAPLFRRVLGSREPVKTGILDANRIFEITYYDEYYLCLELTIAVQQGCESIIWNALGLSIARFDAEGNKVPHIFEDCSKQMGFSAETLSEAIDAVALFEEADPRFGRFELVILDHCQEVQVERSGDPSQPVVTLRLPGASRAKEKARALMSDLLEKRSDIIFPDHGPRGRVYHGQLPLRVRLAEWIEHACLLGSLALVIGICCYLYGRSSWRAEIGILGWLLSVLVGLLLGMNLVRGFYWLFGPRDPDWLRDAIEEDPDPESE